MNEAERAADFEKRKKEAIAEMDAILNKYELGIGVALSGWPQAIVPIVGYSDKKVYGKESTTKRSAKKAE